MLKEGSINIPKMNETDSCKSKLEYGKILSVDGKRDKLNN